jgi:hypothetical protein
MAPDQIRSATDGNAFHIAHDDMTDLPQRQDPDPRLRRAVHPADRAPHPRDRRVLRDLGLGPRSRRDRRASGAKGIILSGGPESTTETGSPRAPQQVFELGLPMLGICYGMQTMAMQLGGLTEARHEREFGYAEVEVDAP